MPNEQSLKKVRKGTKSCIECRQRKIRCIWASDGARSCQSCEARGRSCVSQIYATGASDASRLTSRDRIGRLESTVSDVLSSLHRVEASLGIESAPSSRTYDRNTVSDGEGDGDSDSNASDGSPVNLPSHLRQLFDNTLLGSPQTGIDLSPNEKSPYSHSHSTFSRIRKDLQALLPSKEDVVIIERYTATWVTMVQAVFPASLLFGTGSQMLAHYDEMQSPIAHPVAIGLYVLPMAITILHVPAQIVRDVLNSISDGHKFVNQVSDVIEQTIFNDDLLVGTLEGIEAALMFLRLQLVRGRTRKVWLGIRRVIAIAEMIGLPRAARLPDVPDSISDTLTQEPTSIAFRRKAASLLWDSILVVDRIAGMMFNLPLGTATHRFTVGPTIMADGKVHLPSVMARLASISASLQDIDDLYATQRHPQELLEKVLQTDQETRVFISMLPPEWWHAPAASADSLLQYWVQYLTIRIHIQLALRNDDTNRYAYNHRSCLNACRAMAIRYPQLRGALPVSFFAGRFLDLQALTPAVFLLHSWYKPSSAAQPQVQPDPTAPTPTDLVQHILATMDAVKDEPGGDFAREVSTAIRSVIDMLERSTMGEPRSLMLRVPLLGKIHVGSKAASPGREGVTSGYHSGQHTPGTAMGSQQSGQVGAVDTFTAADFEISNSLDWIMEISDDFSFLPDDLTGTDQMSLGTFDEPY